MRCDDELNGSRYAGEWTEFVYDRGFWRSTKEQMEHLPFVCDRISQSCKGCGLCATLDATYEDFANPELADLGIVPEIGNDRYIVDEAGDLVPTRGVDKKGNPVPGGPRVISSNPEQQGHPGGYFDEMLDALMMQQNPPDMDEAADNVVYAMQEIMAYAVQGEGGPDDYFTEDWNEHEDAMAVLAYCYWWLMVYAKMNGLDQEGAKGLASDFSEEAIGWDIFMLFQDDLDGMYDDENDWIEEFGSTDVY